MNIEKTLLREHSKTLTLKLIKHIGSNQLRFDELMKCFFSRNVIVAQRAAWVIGYSGRAYPELITKHIKKMIPLLRKAPHDAVKRNILRVLDQIHVPPALLGQTFEACIGLLSDSNQPVAIRAYAMTVCVNIVQREPGLKREVELVINEQLVHATAGIRARAKREFKRLHKIPDVGLLR